MVKITDSIARATLKTKLHQIVVALDVTGLPDAIHMELERMGYSPQFDEPNSSYLVDLGKAKSYRFCTIMQMAFDIEKASTPFVASINSGCIDGISGLVDAVSCILKNKRMTTSEGVGQLNFDDDCLF